MNPIIAMLHNLKLNRWHPIVFLERPLPGNPPEYLMRYKSQMHHTSGFETRDAAIASIDDLQQKCESQFAGVTRLCLNEDISWDGEDVPAIVAFFSQPAADGTVVRTL